MIRILPMAFVCVLAVAAAAAFAEDAAFTKVLQPYLRIQSQLAQDSTQGVKEDAEEIGRLAGVLGASGAPVAQKAAGLSRTADLAGARRAFGELTDVLVEYADRQQVGLPPGVEAKYCAMAEKSWFQQGASVRNPYYGKAMLTCGEPRKPSPAP